MSGRPIDFSIFDVDRTITKVPTYSMFLIFASCRLAPSRLLFIPLIICRMLGYKMGMGTRSGLKEFMHAAMLGRKINRAKAEAVAAEFASILFEKFVYSEAIWLVAEERAAGRRVAFATAAPSLYIAPLAQKFFVDDVVASQCYVDGDRLFYNLVDGNCFGPNKRDKIEAYLEKLNIDRNDAHIRFYSDDGSDLPSLEWADTAIAVNPSKKLREIAHARDWKILDWAR